MWLERNYIMHVWRTQHKNNHLHKLCGILQINIDKRVICENDHLLKLYFTWISAAKNELWSRYNLNFTYYYLDLMFAI